MFLDAILTVLAPVVKFFLLINFNLCLHLHLENVVNIEYNEKKLNNHS